MKICDESGCDHDHEHNDNHVSCYYIRVSYEDVSRCLTHACCSDTGVHSNASYVDVQQMTNDILCVCGVV